MIQKSEQYNSDYMSREMDERLEQLEERLTALYANAALETQSDFYDFMEKYKKDYLAMLEKLDAEEITKAEFDLWCSKKILKTTQYKEMLATLTNILVNTDVVAMAIIKGQLPFVVAQSYNFAQSLGFAVADKAGLSIGTFQVYNAWSVQKIIKDNPRLLPKVDIPLDKQWNQDKINTAITHSIIHGDSIPKVAKRLREVTNMDKNSAIRNARTSMTGAENLGRNESIKFMKKNGVPVQLMWSATHDSRTRDTHLLLDRTFQNEKGYFGEGILSKLMKFPGDPEGLPQEIYNCRCRASIYLEGIDHSKDAELYEKFMTENYPDDYRQLKQWEEKTGRAEERRQTLEYQKVLKEIHKTGYYDPSKLSKELNKKEVNQVQTDIKKPIEKIEIPENVEKKLDKFESKYYDAKKEHSMLIGENGEILYEDSGKKYSTHFAPSYGFAESLPPNTYSIHNHPANEMFSPADINNYEKYGTHGLITTTNGEEHLLFNLNDPKWKEYQDKGVVAGGLSVAWGNAVDKIGDEWVQERRNYIDTLTELPREEQRSMLRAWEEKNSRYERQIQWLEENVEKYGFIYRRAKI